MEGLITVTPIVMERLERLAQHWFLHRSATVKEPVNYDKVLTEIVVDYQTGAISNDLLEHLLNGYESSNKH